MAKPDSPLSKLPSISELMKHPRVQGVVSRINQTTLARRATGFLDEMQTYLRQRAGNVPSLGELAERFAHHLLGDENTTPPIINATGVVLGASGLVPPLADLAVEQMLRLAGEFHETETMLAERVGRLLCDLTGAEAAWVASSTDVAMHLVQSVFDENREPVVARLAGLVDPVEFGLTSIPTISAHLEGCDLGLIEGSGMLGGPPCGILLGSQDCFDKLMAHPLATALAANSLTTIALGTTLDLYRQDEPVIHQIPTLQLLSTPRDNLKQRAERLAPLLQQCPAIAEALPIEAESVWCQTANSQYTAHSWTIGLQPTNEETKSPRRLLEKLRQGQRPVFARVLGDRVVLDLRSIFPRWDQPLVAAVEALPLAA